VGESQPVGAVGEEGVVGVGVGQGVVDAGEPDVEGGGVLCEVDVGAEEEGEGQLVLEGEGCDAAEEEAEDDEG
jgi:hypothetical protein